MTEFYAGQIAYQDLIEPKTLKVAGSANIARGDFCTMHTNGYLVPATTEAGKPTDFKACLLYTSPSPRDRQKSRMPSSA